MAKKKNIGYFTQHCGGKVTQQCIDKAKKSNDPKLVRSAALAETMMFGGIKKKATDGVLQVPGVDLQIPELQASGGTVADAVTGGGLNLGGVFQDAGMSLAGQGQDLLKGLKSGKVGISGATDLLAKGATALINKKSTTADDALRNDQRERTGAAVGGAIKGAGKGFDIGNKIIPGLGGVIGGAVGGIAGAFKGKKGAEKDRLAAVGDLRNQQADQYGGILAAQQQFTARAGGMKLPGGQVVPLPDGGKHYIGKKHEAGGIDLKRDNIEVEGGETERKIIAKNGQPIDYIFSEHHKVGKKIAAKYGVSPNSSYADIHRKMESGGIVKNYQELAKDQETDMDAKGKDQYGDRGPEHIKRYGGRRIAQAGDSPKKKKDVLEDKGFQNPFAYNKDTTNEDIRAQNKANADIKTNRILTDETGLPVNRYVPSDNMSIEDIQMIMNSQGAIPLPEVEVSAQFEPKGKTEQDIYDNLGVDGVLKYRQRRSNIHSATAPFGATATTILGGGALAGGLGGTAGGQAAIRGGYNLLKAPIQKYAQGTMSNALKTVAPNVSNASRLGSGIKTALNATSLSQLPSKGKKVVEGVGKEFSEEGGDLESRLKVASNLASLLPGAKFLKAAIGNRGPTVKDALKIGKDIQGGYYGSGLLRTGMAFVPGDQNKYVSMLKDASGVAAKQGAFKDVLNYSNSKDTEYFDDPAKTNLLAEQSKSTSDKDSKTLAMNKTTKPAEKKSRYGGVKMKAQSAETNALTFNDPITGLTTSGLTIGSPNIGSGLSTKSASSATESEQPVVQTNAQEEANETTPTVASTSKPSFDVFANAEEGNVFRQWLNDTNPEAAKKLDLDPQGKHNNAYMRRAYGQYGDEFEVFQDEQASAKEESTAEQSTMDAIGAGNIPKGATQDKETAAEVQAEKDAIEAAAKANTPGDSESTIEETTALRQQIRDLKKANQAVPPEALAAMAAQAVAPIYALTNKPPRVGGYAPQSYQAPKLGRVSGEADKDRLDQNMLALLSSMEGQNLGPAAQASYSKLLQQSQQQKGQIDQRTRQANLQLGAREAMMQSQASQFNIQQNQRAQEYMRNLALMQNQEEFANKFGALQAMGQGIAGSLGDVMKYKSDQKVAKTNVANTIDKEGKDALERANIASIEKQRELNAALQNAKENEKAAKKDAKALKKAKKAGFDTVEEYEAFLTEQKAKKEAAKQELKDARRSRSGGYIRRSGGIRKIRK